jgi:hypothetical protein
MLPPRNQPSTYATHRGVPLGTSPPGSPMRVPVLAVTAFLNGRGCLIRFAMKRPCRDFFGKAHNGKGTECPRTGLLASSAYDFMHAMRGRLPGAMGMMEAKSPMSSRSWRTPGWNSDRDSSEQQPRCVLGHLLDRREQPFPIPDSHERPDLARFRRLYVAAFDEIAGFSGPF